MSKTDVSGSPSTAHGILTPKSSAEGFSDLSSHEDFPEQTPPSIKLTNATGEALQPLASRSSDFEENMGKDELHDNRSPSLSVAGQFLSSSFADISFQDTLSHPPSHGNFSGRGRHPSPSRGDNKLFPSRIRASSFTFRGLHNATPEPPDQEDRYPQVVDAQNSPACTTMPARITSFPTEREDIYLQAVQDHLPADDSKSARPVPLSELDALTAGTRTLSISSEHPSVLQDREGSILPPPKFTSSQDSRNAGSDTQQPPEANVELYKLYNPKDEAPPRSLYFSKNFQDAIKKGRDKCGRLARTLESCSLAEDNESQIHGLLNLAQNLENFRSPVTVTVGIVGDSGAGKSSLINSLLHEEDLAEAAGFAGEACTRVVTEYHQKKASHHAKYTFEVDCMTYEEIDTELEELLECFRRYHSDRKNLPAESIPTADEIEEWKKMADVAWCTFETAFGHHKELTEEFLKRDPRGGQSIKSKLRDWRKELEWPPGLQDNAHYWAADTPEDCRMKMQDAINGSLWPFVRAIRVYLSSQVLKTGVILVDLPGFYDTNAARVRVAERYMYSCDELFLVTNIYRSLTNKGVQDVLKKYIGRNLELWKPSQGVSLICTHSENVKQKEAEARYQRGEPGLSAEEFERLQRLKILIKRAKKDRAPVAALEAENKRILILARNQLIERDLLARYRPLLDSRRLHVFCISNELYEKYIAFQPESSDENEAMHIAMESTGIVELRRFCHGIPEKRQLEAAKHFLNVSIISLINKVELWLAEGDADLTAGKIEGLLQEAQDNFQQELNNGIKAFQTALLADVNSLLMRNMSISVGQWSTNAIHLFEYWRAELHHATWRAIIRREGVSNSDPNAMEWNVSLLQTMIGDMDPAHGQFLTRCITLFNSTRETLQMGTSTLRSRVEELANRMTLDLSLQNIAQDIEYQWGEEELGFHKQFEDIYHNLTTNRESSYVKQYMKPVYRACKDDGNTGVCARDLKRFKSHIQHPGLFQHLQQELGRNLKALIKNTSDALLHILATRYVAISEDLALLQGDEAAVDQDPEFLEALRNGLSEATARMDDILETIKLADTDAEHHVGDGGIRV